MNIDVTQPLYGFDGEPLEKREQSGGDSEKIVPLTVKKAACDALMSMLKDDENMSGSEKLKRHKLASKIYDCDGVFEFSLEDATLVKDLVGKVFLTVVAGAFLEIFEEESKAVKEQTDV